MPSEDPLKRYIEAGAAFTETLMARADVLLRNVRDGGHQTGAQAAGKVEDLIEEGWRQTADVLGVIRREVSRQLTDRGLVTHDDLRKFEQKIEEGLGDLRARRRPSPPGPPDPPRSKADSAPRADFAGAPGPSAADSPVTDSPVTAPTRAAKPATPRKTAEPATAPKAAKAAKPAAATRAASAVSLSGTPKAASRPSRAAATAAQASKRPVQAKAGKQASPTKAGKQTSPTKAAKQASPAKATKEAVPAKAAARRNASKTTKGSASTPAPRSGRRQPRGQV